MALFTRLAVQCGTALLCEVHLRTVHCSVSRTVLRAGTVCSSKEIKHKTCGKWLRIYLEYFCVYSRDCKIIWYWIWLASIGSLLCLALAGACFSTVRTTVQYHPAPAAGSVLFCFAFLVGGTFFSCTPLFAARSQSVIVPSNVASYKAKISLVGGYHCCKLFSKGARWARENSNSWLDSRTIAERQDGLC